MPRGAITATALALLVVMGADAAVADARPARVKGDRILDGSRQELKVRGVVWGGTRFVPAANGAAVSLDVSDAPAAFRQIKRLGGNLVRVEVSSALNTPEGRQALTRLQRLARARGLTLLLANVPTSDADQGPWLRELASWFRGRDNVWYLPATDPDCGARVTGVSCGDPETWVWTQTRYLRVLRAARVRTPIVLNLPDSSQSVALNWVSMIRDRNVVYGVHPRSTGGRFDDADGAALTSSLRDATRAVPVIFDNVARVQTRVDVRRWSSGSGTTRIVRTVRTSTDTVRWSTGLLNWITGWTVVDGGDGAIVNGLGTTTRDRMDVGRSRLTPWGRVAAAGYFAIGFHAASGRDPGSGFPGGFAVGDRGPAVRRVQQQLHRLGYLNGRFVSGRYDQATWHAVTGFQGYARMSRDGAAGAQTLVRLMRADRPQPRDAQGGAHIEVDLTRQIVMLVNGRGRVERVIQVSTGSANNTPAGRFSIERMERMSWSKPFKQWLPYASYFHEGIAFHEYADVPTFPASHGCVRVPFSDAPVMWSFVSPGMPVEVYRS